MSVLHQQRIRIVSTFEGSRERWATYCPCCLYGLPFTTWADALTWTRVHLRQEHCRFCLDGQMPAGRDDVLGELYERCPVCKPVCGDCDGLAVYPANYNTPADLAVDLAVFRLTAIYCDACSGVIALIPLDPEVCTS